MEGTWKQDCSLTGSPGDKDIFGAQRHMRLMRLNIPVFTGLAPCHHNTYSTEEV